MTGGFVLRAEGLRVWNERNFRIDIDDLSVREGEVLGIIGHNGSGKTTLLLALAGLKKPDCGTLSFRGAPVDIHGPMTEYRSRLSMAFQEPLLLHATVFDNVAMGLRIRKMRGRELRSRVEEYCGLFNVGHLVKRQARTLSGGEARRVSLARAMAIRPDLLLLDEPFSSLDLPTRDALLNDFDGIAKKIGGTIILATHDRVEAMRLCTTLAVMNAGKIIQSGAPSEVINGPADEFVAAFVGVETIIEARVAEATSAGFFAEAGGVRIEVTGEAREGESVLLGIRPEQVVLSLSDNLCGTSLRNAFRGVITRTVNMGPHHRVTLDCGFPLVAYVAPHSKEELGLREGLEVTAAFKATAVHLVRKSAGK